MFALVLPGNAGNQRPTGAGNPNVTKLPVNQPKLYKSRCMRVGNGLVKDAHCYLAERRKLRRWQRFRESHPAI